VFVLDKPLQLSLMLASKAPGLAHKQ